MQPKLGCIKEIFKCLNLQFIYNNISTLKLRNLCFKESKTKLKIEISDNLEE
jgi:hypothetical protein